MIRFRPRFDVRPRSRTRFGVAALVLARAWTAWTATPNASHGSTSPLPLDEPPSASASAPLMSEDFDRPGLALSREWVASPGVSARLVPVAGPLDGSGAPAPRPIPGVSGNALEIVAKAAGGVLTRPARPGEEAAAPDERVPPRFQDADSLVLRLARLPDPDPGSGSGPGPAARPGAAIQPLNLEIRFIETNRRAWWWRKLTLETPSDEWREFRLPLRAFRDSGPFAPAWENVNRVALYLRGPGRILVDGLELVPGDAPGAAYDTLEDLRALAFPPDAEVFVHTRPRRPFAVLADFPDLRGDEALAALEAMREQTRRDVPWLPEPDRPVPLVVFRTRDAYRDFWARYARRLNGEIEPPNSDGFTSQGVATSFADNPPGRVRATYVHEANHALLHRTLGLSNRNEWLLEGFATRCQQIYDPRPREEARAARALLAAPAGAASTLDRVAHGRPVGQADYRASAWLVGWLLDDPELRPRFQDWLREIRVTGDTNLASAAPRALGASGVELEPAFRKWLEARARVLESRDGK